MRVLPALVPARHDQQVHAVLQPRWSGTRRMLLVSLTMSAFVAVLCAGMLVAAATAPGDFPWPLTGLLLGALVPAVVYAWWLRGSGLLDPPAWLRVAFVVGGVQLLVGAIPCVGVAVNLASPAGQGIAGGLFALTWVCAGVSVVAARRAGRLLVSPLVPELGATRFLVSVGVRFAVTSPQLLSARLDIGTDHLEWTVRAHRGRSAGPSVRGVVSFRDLVRAVPTVLSGQLTPWAALPDGTRLYAQPGPALLLTTSTGQWMVPVHDAAVIAAVVDRRRHDRTEGNTL